MAYNIRAAALDLLNKKEDEQPAAGVTPQNVQSQPVTNTGYSSLDIAAERLYREAVAQAADQAVQSARSTASRGPSSHSTSSKLSKNKTILNRTADWLKNVAGAAVSGIGSGISGRDRLLYEVGQGSRTREYEERIRELEASLDRAKSDYDYYLQEARGNINDSAVVSQKHVIEAIERELNAYKKVVNEEIQQKATEATSQLSTQLGNQREQKTKAAKAVAGGSFVGNVLTDAAVSGVERIYDLTAGALLGGNPLNAAGNTSRLQNLLPMMDRVFGTSVTQAKNSAEEYANQAYMQVVLSGGTEAEAKAAADQARLSHQVSAWRQAAFGGAAAGLEGFTEIMFDGLAGIYGEGEADKYVERVIRKLASTDVGRTALRTLTGMGGEAVEEMVSNVLSPALMSIYNGKSVRQNYGENFNVVDMLYDGLVGAVSAGMSQAIRPVSSIRSNAQANAILRTADEAQQMLTARGIDKANASRLADLVGRSMYGEELTETQKKALQSSEAATGVMESMRKQSTINAVEKAIGVEHKGANESSEDYLNRGFQQMEYSEAERRMLLDDFHTGNAEAQQFLVGTREALRYGESGFSLEEARTRAVFGSEISDTQFEHAWRLGAMRRAAEEGAFAVDKNTEEGRRTLETNLAFLGSHAEKAADVYESTQHVDRYAEAMKKAVLYASNGVDLQAAVEQARSGERVDNISYLTDTQLQTALEIGQAMAAEREQNTEAQAARFTDLRKRLADAINGGVRSGKIDSALKSAYEYLPKAQAELDEAVRIMTDMQKSGAWSEDEAAYQAAVKRVEDLDKRIRQVKDAVKKLETAEAKHGKKPPVNRKEGRATLATEDGEARGVKYKAVDQESLSETQKAVVKVAETIAKATGLDIRIVDMGTNFGGEYLPGAGGIIYLNIHATPTGKNITILSLSHELTHWLQEYAPKEYAQLKRVVLDEMKKDPEKFSKIFGLRSRSYNDLAIDQVTDEMVANACQTVLMDPEVVQRISSQNPGLFQKIREFLRQIVNDIRAAFSEYDPNENTGVFREIHAAEGALDKITELWLKGFETATENLQAEQAIGNENTATEGGVQMHAFDYETLAAKPDMHITSITTNADAKYDRHAVTKAGLQNAELFGGRRANGSRYVHVKDTGTDVGVSRNSLEHGFDRRIKLNGPVTEKIGEILSNSIRINESNPADLTQTDSSYVLVGMAKNQDNEPAIVVFTVNRQTNEVESFETLHSANAKSDIGNKKIAAGSQSPGAVHDVPGNPTASTISIADLLKFVNKFQPDILPESVLRHFGYDRRPDGKMGERVLYQLIDVEPVQPKTEGWQRTHTTAEALEAYPNLWNVAAEESETRNPTQIASTQGTYRKIYNILKDRGFDGRILDASSGLGYGTKVGREEFGFDVDDIEPYPDKGYKPKYTDYSKLNEKYDAIISSAVLNVLPQDQRDALVVKMGELLNPGGTMYITTRGNDVENLAKTGKNIHLGPMEWIETVKGSYQKGFTQDELKAYLEDALGDDFIVEKSNKSNGGKFNNNTSIVVTKKGGAQLQSWSEGPVYNERALVSEETLDKWLKDYAASNPNYAQAYITYMDPDDFLRMTTSGAASRINIRNQADGLQVDKAVEYSREQPIQLHIDTETGKVEGHEGRHRMVALSRAGLFEVPVLLFDSSNKYSKQPMERLVLTGQDFNGHTNYQTTTVRDVQPLSRGNRDVVAEKFSKKQARERIGEDYKGQQTVQFQQFDSDSIKNDLDTLSKIRDKNGAQLQVYAFEHDEPEYRKMLTQWGGMSEQQIDDLFHIVDSAVEIVKNNLEELDYAWEADIDDRGFSPVKPNSDPLYKVSQDFSTLCRKRILQQVIMNELQAAKQRALTREEGIAIRDALVALQAEGKQIEVACALCYVESARMRSPAQIQRFLDNREKVMLDFFAGKDRAETKARMEQAEARERQAIYEESGLINGYDVRDRKTASLKKLPGKIADRIRSAKKAAKAEYKPTAKQQAEIDLAKRLQVQDFTTPEGLEDLAKNHREIFDAYTSFIRNATNSKGIENDTWWRAGDSQKISDLLIEQMNRENGLRTQSWSDFQVKHLIDYIAAVIELSTRGAAQHAYTKVYDYVDLMGNTGIMINMSLIPTREYHGKLEYDDVEGFVYDKALEMREKYPETAGTICIGVDDKQIRQLLESDVIDYVIPYHRSGMAAHVRAAMHIPNWSEYEAVQHAKALKGSEAQANAEKYGVKLLDTSDPRWHKEPNFSDWFDLKKAKQTAARLGTKGKYGVMTGGYMAMQEAAEKYKKICAERGLAPKFSYGKVDFTTSPNYWKLLIDRKMVNNKTGGIIEQKPIRPNFDMSTIERILNDELERYGKVKKDQDEAIRRVTEAFLGEKIAGGMKAEDIAKAMQKPVDNISIVNAVESAPEIQNVRYQRFDEAHNEWAPTFYSKMENTINEWTNGKGQPLPAKMSAQQVVGWLKGKGVKTEEIRWSGIEPWLEGRKTVTKDELLQVMAENQINIETKVLQSGETSENTWLWNPPYGEPVLVYSFSELEEQARQIAEDWDLDPNTVGYRNVGNAYVFSAEEDGEQTELFVATREAGRTAPGDTHWSEYIMPGGRNYREILFKMPGLVYQNDASEIHWREDAPGTIAHARVQDMMDSEFEQRVLFVEEIQSDLHNAGAGEEFIKNTKDVEKRINTIQAEIPKVQKDIPKGSELTSFAEDLSIRAHGADFETATQAALSSDYIRKWLQREEFPLYSRIVAREKESLTPLERMINQRVTDLVQSVMSEEEAEQVKKWRYAYRRRKELHDELTEVLSAIEKGAPDVPFAGSADTYHEYVMKHLLRLAAEGGYDAIGWTTAQQQADRWSEDYLEGYTIEYDRKIPKFMSKYTKQWGGKVDSLFIHSEDGIQEVWGVQLTDAMKKDVLQVGQPLFQRFDDTYTDTAEEGRGREEAYTRIQNENAILKTTIDELKKTVKGKDATIGKILSKFARAKQSDADKLARRIMKEYGSRADVEEVAAAIKAVGDYYVQTPVEKLSEEKLKEKARDAARIIAQGAEATIQTDDGKLTEIKSSLQGKKVTIRKEFLGDLDSAGGLKAVKDSLFGKRVYLSTEEGSDRISVDRLYEQLHGDFGDYYFPEAGSDRGPANEAEEILIIQQVLAASEGMTVNPFEAYMSEAVEAIANNIAFRVMNENVLRPMLPAEAEQALDDLEAAAGENEELRRKLDKATTRGEVLKDEIARLKQQGKLSNGELMELRDQVYELTKALKKANDQYSRLQRQSEQRIAQVREEGAARVAEVKAKERERAAKQVQALKDHYREVQDRARERREESASFKKYRKQVQQKAGALYEMLMTNSDKKHVPDALKVPVAEFLESINFTSKRQLRGGEETKADQAFGLRLRALERALSGQQSYAEGTQSPEEAARQPDLGGLVDISEENLQFLRDTIELIDMALRESRDFTINTMSGAQLKQLSNFLSNLNAAIRNLNNFMANARYQSVREAASKDIEYFESLGDAGDKDLSGTAGFLKWLNGTPFYVFKRFGDGGKSIFDGLAAGWDKMAFNVQEIMAFTEKLYTDKEVNDWKNEVHSLTLEDGSKLEMTTAQIMELSMLLNREQALKHIEKGGIAIADFEVKKGGKKHRKQNLRQYHLSFEDIQMITGKLNERQRTVAKALQQYMAVKGAEWGNEISMRRFGYSFYTEGENYYPIKTMPTDRPMSDSDLPENASMFRLLNLSSSKSLNPKASNALVVGNIFDTFADHMSDMAKLNGMGLPILDAIKWFNYKERIDDEMRGTYKTRTIQAAMKQAYGGKALSYFRTLLKDINGTTESGDRGTNVPGKVMSNYKIASVGANLRVALLQPTSYVRASATIKPLYLFGVIPTRAAYQEAMKYSGTAVWKDMGFFDTDVARSMRAQIQHDDTFKDKLVDKSMWMAEMGDKLTWSMLWTAAKRQTAAENPGLKGEALLQKTSELFRETIYASQIMDSTLTRSELMRSKAMYDRALSAFMAEPTLSYNILLDAYSQYNLDSRRHGKAEAWIRNSGKIGKAFAVYASSAVFAAIVEAFADAARDDDDDEFVDKWLDALLGENARNTEETIWKRAKSLWLEGNLGQDLSILGKLPFIKDIMSLLQGYGASNMSTDGIESLLKIADLFTGNVSKRITPWGKLYKYGLQPISQISGLPVANLSRDVIAIWNNTVGTINPDMKLKKYDSIAMSDEMKAGYEDYVSGTGISERQYKKILESANTDGNTSVKQDELGEYLVNALKAGDLTEAQAQALWKSQWHKDGSKTFDTWRGKTEPKSSSTGSTKSTASKSSTTKSTSSASTTKPAATETIKDYDGFKRAVPVYSDNVEAMYNAKPAGMSLDRYAELLKKANTDNNDSLKQDEVGFMLKEAIIKKEISFDEGVVIWRAQWNKPRSKTFEQWAIEHP